MNRSFVRIVALATLAAWPLGGTAVAEPARYPKALIENVGPVRLISQPDRDAMLAGVQVFLLAGIDRQTTQTSGVAALVAECIARTPVDGVPLRDAIASRGGFLNYTLEAQYVHFYVEARSEKLSPLLGLVGGAFAKPDFSRGAIEGARAALGARIVEAEKNPLTVGLAMFKESFYGGGVAGLPALGTSASLAALTTADVQSFYAASYRRGGALVSVAGRSDPELLTDVRKLIAAIPAGDAPPAPKIVAKAHAKAPLIVTHRDVGAPWLLLGFSAPSPGSRDFGAMLVIEALLANALERSSATALPASARTVGALYLYDTKPASLAIYVNGGNIEPTLARREIVLVSKSLAAQPLAADALRRYKATAQSSFLGEVMTVFDRSWLAGNFAVQGLDADYVNAALDNIETTSSADVRRVAKKYLQSYTAAIVLPRERPAVIVPKT